MRFRRSKSAIVPRQTPKQSVGRPRKEEGDAAHKFIRVSGKLLNMIIDYRDIESLETYNDTILRMLDRKTQIITQQSERIKELEQENRQLTKN